jgi:hypothetical protein
MAGIVAPRGGPHNGAREKQNQRGLDMRAVLLGLALTVGIAASASAQTVGGQYSVTGTNPNGSTYTGTAVITPSGSACRIRWEVGSTSSGICMLARRAFAAAYVLNGKAGLVVYELFDDGTLKGTWTLADSTGVGTETLTPAR